MKKIYTSYYANIRNLPSYMNPIGISVGKNKWFEGPYDMRLAPTWAMMKQPRAKYDQMFMEKLSKLDARQIYESLPDNAVLLCYETYNDWCHRRCVAEWLEAELGIEVTEWGLERHECYPYAELGANTKGEKRQVQQQTVNESASYYDEIVARAKAVRSIPYEKPVTLFDFEVDK